MKSSSAGWQLIVLFTGFGALTLAFETAGASGGVNTRQTGAAIRWNS